MEYPEKFKEKRENKEIFILEKVFRNAY